MLYIKSVTKSSIAGELGLEPGTQLLSVDGRDLVDFLDWEFLTADTRFMLKARTPNGELIEYDIERPEGLPLGIELDQPEVIRCDNRCGFCFVKGNPKGLRRALYVKDDDYRLSFRYGNFVTLTNLKQHEFDRIIEYKLSPLYISVHATHPDVRRKVLGNPHAPDVMKQLAQLLANGIRCHTQVVLQPGVNDGQQLANTLDDLYSLGENLTSVSVVPVGLTSRNVGSTVRQLTAAECRNAIRTVDSIAAKAFQERTCYWAYGADELYLNAEVPLPPPERYDGFEQLENGVGVVRHFELQVAEFSEDLSGHSIGVATGTAMGRLFPEILGRVQTETGAHFELLVLENDLFGPTVTTAGLLPGFGFANACRARDDLDLVLIPAEAVNDNGVFIDDLSFADLCAGAPVEIRKSYHIADAFVEARDN